MDDKPSTRSEILSCLRQRPHKVPELIASLGLTRNAILVPLLDLERRGLVRRIAEQRTGRAGKPAQVYELVAEEMERVSPAYQALAPHLFRSIMKAGEPEARKAMEDIGTTIGADICSKANANGTPCLEAALAFLRSQGAQIEVKESEKDIMVLSHSCPIGLLVRVNSCVCSLVSSLLQETSGLATSAECDYAEKLTCQFRLKKQGADIDRR